MFSVETHSFLPNQQSDRGDFPRQRKARHRWFQPFGNERNVEVLERPGDSGGPRAAPLKIFFRSWLWFWLSPRMAWSFLERLIWPSTKRYSPLTLVFNARPL